MADILENPIEEYFKEGLNGESTFPELFEANKENVDLRTDLITHEAVLIISKLQVDNEFLDEKLNFRLFDALIEHYLRNLVSLERKSRMEFVDINRRDRFKENLKDFGNFSNIMKVKE